MFHISLAIVSFAQTMGAVVGIIDAVHAGFVTIMGAVGGIID